MEYEGSVDFETLFHAIHSKFHFISFWLCIPPFELDLVETVMFFTSAKTVAFLRNKSILEIRTVSNAITGIIVEVNACEQLSLH